MKFRTPPTALLVFAGLLSQATAQIPPQSVLVTRLVLGTARDGVFSVTTAGKATTVTGHGRGTHKSVALSHHDPAVIWGLGGWLSTTMAIPVAHYTLNAHVATRGKADGALGVRGVTQRCHIYKNNLLVTLSPSQAGLYKRSRNGGNAALIASIPLAFDIAVLNDKVYVTTWSKTIVSSSLWEVDMSVSPVKTRVVKIVPGTGSAPAVFKAIGTYGWENNAVSLIIGDSAGKLWFVDPSKATNNAFTLTFGASRGVAEAIMTHPDPSVGVVIATATGLYKQTDYNTGGKPFYTVPGTTPIHDIAVLGGGKSTFGSACAGSKGEPMHDHGLNDWPYTGNTNFNLRMGNGPVTTPGTLILGLSRNNWGGVILPLDLGFMGAPKCFLNVEMLMRVGVATDGNGQIRVPAPIPLDSRLIGMALFTQWGIFEKTANTAGLITSQGLKLTVR